MDAAANRVQPGLLYKRIHSILRPNCFLALLLGLGVCLFCLPLQAQTATTGASLSFPLKYTEKSPSLSCYIEPGKQEVKFRVEPDFGKDKVLRRELTIGPNKDDFLGFAADLTRRSLYLDLNRNLDLTDDPGGVRQGEGRGESVVFKDIRLNFQFNGISRSYSIAAFYCYGSDCYGEITSSYQGEIELYGQKWRLEVQDNLDGQINKQDQFLIAPATSGESPTYRGMQVPKKLFFGGHLYQLNLAFRAGQEDSLLTADFAEVSASLGELVLDGQFVRRLVLEGDGLAILDSPTQPILLPAEKYQIATIYLQSPPHKTMFVSGDVSQMPKFSIAATTPFRLKAGGPLQSSVTAVSRGSSLQVNYLLKGVGGEPYSASDTARDKPPKLAIYQGDRLLKSDDFQFG
jgi:hypothetical protein